MSGVPRDWYSPLPQYWIGKSNDNLKGLINRADPNYEPFLGSGLPGLTSGEVIAAFKIYICLVLMAHDKKQEKNVGKNKVRTTYEEIQLYLKISRSMVSRGLKLLEQTHAIERTGYKPLVYRVCGLEKERDGEWKGFVSIPKGHLFGHRRNSSAEPIMLSEYPNRGAAAMNGLALYLLLVSVTQRDSNVALITYAKIQERIGLSNREIRKALDLLINHDLLSVLRVTNETTFEVLGLEVAPNILLGSPNAYLIKGLKGRRYNERVNTLEDYVARSLGKSDKKIVLPT